VGGDSGRLSRMERRWRLARNSFGYDADSPPPMEVEWNPEIANTVNLVGNLGVDPQVQYLPSGKVLAKFTIAVAGGNKTNWFDCEMWESVARSAQVYLQKGSKVHVVGRLEKDTWTDKITGDRRSKIKVLVSTFNTVRSFAPMSPSGPNDGVESGSGSQGQSSRSSKSGQRSGEEKWNDFFKEPDQYWDNRALKVTGERSPRYPDFKHKTTQEALWVDSWDSPNWVKAILSQMDDAALKHRNTGTGSEDAGFDGPTDGEEIAEGKAPPQW